MDDVEDFIISEPYALTDDDRKAIEKASPGEKNGQHWMNPCLDEFKKRFRDDMLLKQNYMCAYCRLKLHPNEATPEIEHIVDKGGHPDWMYEPFNLCLSCKICNTKKNRKNVLKDVAVAALPTDSEAYLLIHPHLDKYSDYIEFVGDVLYKPKGDGDSKGANTIKFCELNRLEVAIARADKYIDKHGIGQPCVDFLLQMMGNPMNKKLIKADEAENFTAKLQEKIRTYKKSHSENENA